MPDLTATLSGPLALATAGILCLGALGGLVFLGLFGAFLVEGRARRRRARRLNAAARRSFPPGGPLASHGIARLDAHRTRQDR